MELLPGAVDGLRRLAELDCGLVVVTNQSGVARGYFDEPMLARIHARFEALLAAEGIRLDAIYYCPHGSEANCECRKPRPGMALRAAREHGFDLKQAVMIGDRPGDVELGRAVGATSILVRTGVGEETERSGECRADFTADDLRAAAEWIAARRA